jgi:hypothetical protein
MKYLLAFLLSTSLISCKNSGITFDPQFRVPHIRSGGLVSRDGHVIRFDDVEVQQFGCLHKTKIAELKILLQQSKPMKSRVSEDFIQKELDKMLQDIGSNE